MPLTDKKSEQKMHTWNRDTDPNGWDDFARRFEAFVVRLGKGNVNTGSALICLCDHARGYVRAPMTMGAEIDSRLVGGGVMRTTPQNFNLSGVGESPGSATKPSTTEDESDELRGDSPRDNDQN